MPGPRELLTLPVSRSTGRRVAHVVIGAALATPYVVLSSFAVPALEGGLVAVGAWGVTIALYFVGLPIATGMLSPVRELEVGAARRLLGVQLDDPQPLGGAVSWTTRWRSAGWFVAHLVIEHLDLELTNPLDRPRPQRSGGGRGLNGIQERVTSLRGHVSAGPDAGQWRITVSLPLHPTP